MADREQATGVLGLVQDFVNTIDLQDGPDELSDPAALSRWLAGRGLINTGEGLTVADLNHAIALREAMRGVIGANTGGAVFPIDVATVNSAASASRLRARFAADGKARLEPEAAGVEGAMGRLVAALFAAMGDPHWSRLKLCSRPACRWVFYDRSRNHSSRWCTMASCGNREKAKRFRGRAKSAGV